MTMALLVLVVILALAAGGIRYAHLTHSNLDSNRHRAPGKGAFRAFAGTLALGLLLIVAFIGWVVYVMAQQS